tara:strand:- start:31651 stop:32928 length:1278 start_codon:yes stop_codon:yes gene_type:complete
MKLDNKNIKLGVIGLGYVGLPLAVEFSKIFSVIGFDISESRIKALKTGIDDSLEVSKEELISSKMELTTIIEDLKECNVFIVTVPTPIDSHNTPNLLPLFRASQDLGGIISRGSIIIFESTVYPGATEEDCVPLIEKFSGLRFNKDFFCGYSPERINPGDKKHRLPEIIKITSGSTHDTAKFVDDLYKNIIKAGTHKVSSIKIAEAAKVIENTQRDVNIALINELAMIFDKLNIDTQEVLEAASTKWNFLPFQPGLVGGHCIGVDPYYLTYKAQSIGYRPEMILAGRRINDGVGSYIAGNVTKLMLKKKIPLLEANILIMGLAFKENCPDLRNTKVVNIITELEDFGLHVDVWDPWVKKENAQKECNVSLIDQPTIDSYDAIVIAVSHTEFIKMGLDEIKKFGKNNSIIYDVKYLFDAKKTDGRL